MASEDVNSPLISVKNHYGSLSTADGASKPSKGRGSKILVTLCILVTELCERLTYYGMAANLILFSRSVMNLHAPWPSTISYLFRGWFITFPFQLLYTRYFQSQFCILNKKRVKRKFQMTFKQGSYASLGRALRCVRGQGTSKVKAKRVSL